MGCSMKSGGGCRVTGGQLEGGFCGVTSRGGGKAVKENDVSWKARKKSEWTSGGAFHLLTHGKGGGAGESKKKNPKKPISSEKRNSEEP